ncbi:MAG: L-threonylcarbamoyladenylate synthase [Candidatus Gracilibacteria bacterium]|nr:L-threonylcarbamoyladenylate synthase [bacterium]MDZ4216980.1 L-threonylcarbamoyladenylate synthase [Candidatus Gracilibacteria bacterium]
MTLAEAAQKMRNGELMVFPTETVYGLGAMASNDNAVQKIFEVKGRPQHNPLILHIAENRQLDALVEIIPKTARLLINHFWPGPLTICFRKSEKVSDLVTAGLSTVCVRRPDHPMAQELLKELMEPLAAPSANLSGKPSTTSFEDAKRQMEGKGVFFLDGGSTPLGLESTVVDCSGESIRLLRPGCVSTEELEEVLGERVIDASSGERIESPGQLLEHYAPSGDLTVLFGKSEQRRQWMKEHLNHDESTLILGLVGSDDPSLPGHHEILSPEESDLEHYAARIFHFLNYCDHSGAEQIVLELPKSKDPLLPALLNRLEKASKGHIISLEGMK